jgi:hypothetical protein
MKQLNCVLGSGFLSSFSLPLPQTHTLSAHIQHEWNPTHAFGNKYEIQTESRGPVVNTPASYPEGSRFKSRIQRPAILTEVFMAFHSSSRRMPR